MNDFSNKYPTETLDQLSHIKAQESQFIEIIRKRLGIITPTNNKELHKTIQHVCQKFKCSTDDYLQMLISCPDNSPFLESLVAEITIGETYFFRDKHQMNLLKNNLLPRIITKKRQEKNLSLRIWSAGCASGEEIYTIAILLNELIPDIKHWKLNLLGTDINTTSLKKAKLGRYNKWSMRGISDDYKHRYFETEENQFILSSKIINKVDFSYLNLNDDTYPSILNGTNSQDLIICRNVLIYFNKDSIARFMKKICLSLIDGGTLLLGASDPVNLEGTSLVFQHHEGMVFTRHDSEQKVIKKTPPDNITKPFIPKKRSTLTPKTLKKIPHIIPDTVENLNIKAKEAADLGQLEKAITYCEKALAINSTHKNTHFILALTLAELNRLQEAEASFRKTLYLDHKFIEGHFQLGLLLIKKKQYKEGLKSLENALTIVNRNEPNDIVPGSQGLSYRRFGEILKAEIDLYMTMGGSTK